MKLVEPTTSGENYEPSFNGLRYYLNRLDEPHLIEESVILPTPQGYFLLAVPVGERRICGSIETSSREYADHFVETLSERGGFPDLRVTPGWDGNWNVSWGKPIDLSKSAEEMGRDFGYTEEAIANFTTRAIQLDELDSRPVKPRPSNRSKSKKKRR